MILFKKWMIYKMNEQKSKVSVQRPVFEESNSRSNRREKNYEDDLLRKLQTEFQMPNDDTATTPSSIARDDNRTQYEQELLERIMQTVHHVDTSEMFNRPQKSETLMITSAVPLTEDEKERLARKFIEKTGRALRRITSVVDPSLLTGVRLQSETFYYEVSGQKKLREIRAFLEKSWLQGDE